MDMHHRRLPRRRLPDSSKSVDVFDDQALSGRHEARQHSSKVCKQSQLIGQLKLLLVGSAASWLRMHVWLEPVLPPYRTYYPA